MWFIHREYPIYIGNAYAGVYKMTIEDGEKPEVEKYKQFKKFVKNNVKYFPGFDLDSNYKLFS